MAQPVLIGDTAFLWSIASGIDSTKCYAYSMIFNAVSLICFLIQDGDEPFAGKDVPWIAMMAILIGTLAF